MRKVLKPVNVLTDEGKLIFMETVRTYKSAMKKVVEKVIGKVDPDNGVIHVSYTNNNEDLEFVLGILKERLPKVKTEIYTLPATIVAHVGLEAIAVGYVNYNI